MTETTSTGAPAPSRRQLLAGAAAATTASLLPTVPAQAQSRAIKVGFVTPRSGPLAGFAEA
ncbi:MAG TPA: hypothetical protein VIL72_00415, partial [Beijerinckiaceae bacterium]